MAHYYKHMNRVIGISDETHLCRMVSKDICPPHICLHRPDTCHRSCQPHQHTAQSRRCNHLRSGIRGRQVWRRLWSTSLHAAAHVQVSRGEGDEGTLSLHCQGHLQHQRGQDNNLEADWIKHSMLPAEPAAVVFSSAVVCSQQIEQTYDHSPHENGRQKVHFEARPWPAPAADPCC
jgi:hypothetical protein